MLLLGLETATSAGSAIILNINNNGQPTVIEIITTPNGEQSIGYLPPLLADILPRLEHPLTAIITNKGPGSFTGIRVGLSLAQGLALGLQVPVVTVSSLQALAWKYQASTVQLPAPGKTAPSYFQGQFADDFLTPLGEPTTVEGVAEPAALLAVDLVNVAVALHQRGMAWDDPAFSDPTPLYIRPCYTVTNAPS